MLDRIRISSALATAALVAVVALGMAACGDDEPAAVVTPVTPPTVPTFQPQPVEVALGGSGQSVTLMTTEAGGYTLNGEAFASGGTQTAEVGGVEVTYTLTLAEGSWSAACACEIEVALGASGNIATLTLDDADGSFSLGGEPLASGDQRMGYAFALEGGMWTASFVAVTQAVALGATGGTLELRQVEDGSWIGPDGAAVPTGSRVVAGGNSYVLTLGADGTWTASFEPDETVLLGTGLTVSVNEAGRYEVAGVELDLGADGAGPDTITLDTGERYRVTRNEDGLLQGARQESGLEGGAGNLGLGANPELAEDSTYLQFDLDPDPRFSFTGLLGAGTDEARGEEFAAGVIADIEEARDDAALLLEALEEGNAELGNLLGGLWNDINAHLDRLFGTDPTPDDPANQDADDIGPAPEPGDFLDEVDKILAALASEEALLAGDDGDGPFAREFDGDYGARDWEATAWLGTLGSTRFGVASYETRADASGEATARRGSFRYSTARETGAVRRVAQRLDLSGDALYEGETRAIDGEGTVYSGAVSLQVRLGASRVNGVVQGLAAEDGSRWEPSFSIAGRGVDTIQLPEADLTNNAGWNNPGGEGWVRVSSRAGLNRRIPFDFSFRGLLLGRGNAAGEEAVGDWGTVVGAGSEGTPDWIRGAFGAELSGVDDVRLPEVEDVGGVVEATIANIGASQDREGFAGLDFGSGELQLGELRQADGSRWALDLAAAYESQGEERLESGERWVELARDELEGLRERMLTFQRLDADDRDETVRATEERIWNDAMNEVSRLLFGLATGADTPDDASDDSFRTGEDISERFPDTSEDPEPGRGYPSAGSVSATSDDEALDTIDDLLEALASEGGYREAYEAGGVFANVYTDTDSDGMPDADSISRDPDGSDDFDRAQSQVTSLAGSTRLTRFGLFWGTETASAVNAGERVLVGGRRAAVRDQYSSTGLYAYTELGRARYAERDPTLPRGGSATYRGEAAAAYKGVLYTGTSEVLVTWQEPARAVVPGPRGTERAARLIGSLNATLALERLDNGDRLVTRVDGGNVEIDEIEFSNSWLEWRADGTIRTLNRGFQGAGRGLAVTFRNRTDARRARDLGGDDGTATGNADPDDLRQNLDATFAGRTVDAPAAVIGYFKLQNPDPALADAFRFDNRANPAGAAADTDGSRNTQALVGAFGADLDPDSILAAVPAPPVVDPGPPGELPIDTSVVGATISRNGIEFDADAGTLRLIGAERGLSDLYAATNSPGVLSPPDTTREIADWFAGQLGEVRDGFVSGDPYVTQARAALQELRAALVASHPTGDRTVPTAILDERPVLDMEQDLWAATLTEVRAMLILRSVAARALNDPRARAFAPLALSNTSNPYPSRRVAPGAGSPENNAESLAILDRMLAPLDDPVELQISDSPGEVYHLSFQNRRLDYFDSDDDFERAPLRHSSLLDMTEFTRFGVIWTEFAASAAADYEPRRKPAVFAYSTMETTSYAAADTAALLPGTGPVEAVYVGRAALGLFEGGSRAFRGHYTGDARLTLEWHDLDSRDRMGLNRAYRQADLDVSISNIRAAGDGGPLLFNPGGADETQVAAIAYENAFVAWVPEDASVPTVDGDERVVPINLHDISMSANPPPLPGLFSDAGRAAADRLTSADGSDFVNPAPRENFSVTLETSPFGRHISGLFNRMNLEFAGLSADGRPAVVLGHFEVQLTQASGHRIGSPGVTGDSLVAAFGTELMP